MVIVAPATGWPAAFTTTPVTPDEVTFCAITTVGAASNEAMANGSIPLRILLIMVSTFGLQREENLRDLRPALMYPRVVQAPRLTNRPQRPYPRLSYVDAHRLGSYVGEIGRAHV